MRPDHEHPQPAGDEQPAPARLAAIADPGWLFLIAGLVLVSAMVVLPAMRDLDHARYHRDSAAALEQYRLDRLERYTSFYSALEYNDELLLRRLASTQLNRQPVGTEFVVLPAHNDSADVFHQLEPAFVAPVPPRPTGSFLERLAMSGSLRLWLIGLGGLFVVYGLMPAATRKK